MSAPRCPHCAGSGWSDPDCFSAQCHEGVTWLLHRGLFNERQSLLVYDYLEGWQLSLDKNQPAESRIAAEDKARTAFAQLCV